MSRTVPACEDLVGLYTFLSGKKVKSKQRKQNLYWSCSNALIANYYA